MSTATSSWTVPVPERMWFIDTAMGAFRHGNRTPDDQSAFEHWHKAGAMFMSPWRAGIFDKMLSQIQAGDPVFAYEHGRGVVAIGRVSSPKTVTASTGPTALYPHPGTPVLAVPVDWDTSVTRTKRQVWEVTALGGTVLKSAGPKNAFFPMAMDMLQEAHDRYRVDPDADEAAAVKRIASSPAYTPKMRAQLGQARIGQGRFRTAVLAREPRCRVTGTMQARYLVASHIKPWAVCTGDEHLDGANGLMLAPHVDHLFDTGLISFEDNGDLMLAPLLDPQVLQAWHIDAGANVGPFAPDQARYLAYHRQ
jgi:hypothetical protein